MIRRRELLGLLPAAVAGGAQGGPLELRVAKVTPRTVRLSLGQPGARTANPGTLLPGALTTGGAGRRIPVHSAVAIDAGRACGLPGAPRIAIDASTGQVAFEAGAPIFGLGEGGPQFDRRGHHDDMRNGQVGPQQRTFGARIPIPFVIGASGWAIYFHQPAGAFDFTDRQEGKFLPAEPPSSQALVFFVSVARDPAALLAEYANLTGFPEMPPRWSFGYMQSHRTLTSREELMSVARTFRAKRLPCDALIYLGTGFCPSGWNTGHGSFRFNLSVFDNPSEIIQQLHEQHFRVILHVVYLGRALRGSVHDSCRVQNAEEAACYWRQHQPVEETGIDGWWPDEGDALDMSSRLGRTRLYFEGSLRDRPNVRPFALHRNGAPGTQRYGAFVWTGDVNSSWEALRLQVPVGINAGLSGLPYWGTDTGGFIPTRELTGELYVRWFQFSAFCPLFRSHGRTWKLRLPWQWNSGEMGPSELSGPGSADPDPAELHNAAVEPICRKYLELRYRMLPYIYSLARECHDAGLPLMRALWLHYPDDSAAAARGDEYLWGRDLLIAPVVERGSTARRLYLPRGRWYDFWTETALEGGREITREVDLATIPVYARAGAILPLGPVKQYTDQPVDGAVQLIIYPGDDGLFVLYDDDGATYNFRRGAFTRIRCEWRDRRRELVLAMENAPPGLRQREFEIRMASETNVRNIVLGRKSVVVRF